MEERLRLLGNDARNAVEVAMAQRDYQRVVLFGKSLGSLVLAWLLVHEAELLHATYVWLTPLVRVPFLREAVRRAKPRSLFIAGDADPLFDASAMQDLMKHGDFHLLVLSNANHSLEVEGDLDATLKGMALILHTLDEFLQKG
jgi:pimeloyl-ACP methyl ester carboxylesterase